MRQACLYSTPLDFLHEKLFNPTDKRSTTAAITYKKRKHPLLFFVGWERSDQ
jgi:hypothetical protein